MESDAAITGRSSSWFGEESIIMKSYLGLYFSRSFFNLNGSIFSW